MVLRKRHLAELRRKRRARAAEREAGSDVQSESDAASQAAGESDADASGAALQVEQLGAAALPTFWGA